MPSAMQGQKEDKLGKRNQKLSIARGICAHVVLGLCFRLYSLEFSDQSD